MKIMCGVIVLTFAVLALTASGFAEEEDLWVVYPGGEGPGKGKHIVLVSGDDEYRSEEGLPQLGKILSVRHGFKCTVLFPIDPKDSVIVPSYQNNIPGLESLATADMMIMGLRFRELPDDKMKYIDDFVESGKPILGIRTSTHAFHYRKNKESRYAKYDFQSSVWKGGFGQQVLGDTWLSHHGNHGDESTRGVINKKFADHPILRGVTDVWGPTDVYGVRNLKDADILMHGAILTGMKPTDKPVDDKRNKPMMPLVWTKTYKKSPIICTTMGAATDLESEGLRRLLVNACYWGLGMEDKIPTKNNVDVVGEYKPTPFGFGKFKTGVRPSAHKL